MTTTPPTDKFGIINIGYNKYLFDLPKAIRILETFAEAQILEGYGDDKKLVPIKELSLEIISNKEIQEIRTRILLQGKQDE
jgi:hypothetical protein